jgi:hypothetical protein
MSANFMVIFLERDAVRLRIGELARWRDGAIAKFLRVAIVVKANAKPFILRAGAVRDFERQSAIGERESKVDVGKNPVKSSANGCRRRSA